MSDIDLFTPLQLGPNILANRMVMAPLTRNRSTPEGVPHALNVEYYRQRAGAGLILSEATCIMPEAVGYPLTPGIWNDAQAAGWKAVTDAVHSAGGKIFCQLWHVGRISHPDLQPGGILPVAPSAIKPAGDAFTLQGPKPFVTPRALELAELPGIVAAYRNATHKAMQAGFDGVEVHAANGYLLDEFLRDGANHRQGPYGGAIEHRARLLLEVIEATCAVWGSGKVGVRVSPLNSYNAMRDSDPVGLIRWLGKRLNDFDLAYWHVMRADFLGQQHGDVMTPAREAYDGVLIGNMGYTAAEADAAIAAGKLDAVAFGSAFIANPDLPERIRDGAPLATPDSATFYSPGAKGYTDYPRFAG